jgi:colanic acid/amylovoran biosynthesis glycosyltransferase
MKIAFFVHRFPVISEAFIVNAAVGLIDRGHSVDIYGLDGPAELDQQRHALVASYDLENRARCFRLQGSPRRQMALAPIAGLKVAAAYGLKAGAVLDGRYFRPGRIGLRALHEADLFRNGGRYDILHCHFGTLAEAVLEHRRAGFLSGRVIVHFRGYDISKFVQERGERVYDRVFREADAFIANCRFFRDRAIALGSPEACTHIVASGVAVDRFRFAPRSWTPGQPLRLLAVGRLVEKKGFRFAIEALARIVSEGVDARLAIAGGGPLEDSLRSLAAALGLADRVRVAGPATHEQIAQMLDDSDVFLAPSSTASDGDSDASINTIKEAMAAGCPFVASNHGGIPELVEGVEAGVMAPEGDAAALADGIAQLLARSAEWSDMGRRGRAHIVSNYSIETVTSETLKVYEQAAVTHPRQFEQ